MLELWHNYVNKFRKLIANNWIIVKRKGSCLYYWVYPYSSVTTKYKMREAYEILNASDNASSNFGSSRAYTYRYSIFTRFRL